MALRWSVADEATKFIGMIPVRLTKAAGWLLEWPMSLVSKSGGHKSIFVIAIPRSGSTLLYNLIAWNDGSTDVVGYGENCASYRSARDAQRLRARTMLYLRRRRLPTHVADKVVQSRYRVGEAVLQDDDCYFIFIDRAQEDVVASLERKLKLSGPDAQALYASRSSDVAEIRSQARNGLTVSYEHLLEDPEAVLEQINDFLDLEQRLTAQYRVPPNVGNFSYGDDGKLIRSGRIVAPTD